MTSIFILRFRPINIISFLAFLGWTFAVPPSDTTRRYSKNDAVVRSGLAKKTDSLETLHILLSSEMKPQNRIWVLKNGRLVDSLSHGLGKMRREDWDKVIQDSAIAKEMKSQEEFQAYWKKIEQREGITEFKSQMQGQDIVKSRIPKLILFDSTLIVYPGWVVLLSR